MTFLTKLLAGHVPLRITFWLIGIPLAAVWDVSGGCILAGCGVRPIGPQVDQFIAGFLILLFTLSSMGVAFVSVAIWRSASTGRRAVWWERLLAFSAKTYAALSAATAFVVLLAILYGFLHYAVGHLNSIGSL